VAHVRGNRPVHTLLSLQAVGLVFFTISVPVEVVFAQRSLHAGAGGYGALLSAWGAGAVVGSAIYARWSRGSARVLIAAGAGALGLGFAVMAVAPTIEVAVIGSALGGLSNGLEMVAARTAIQERTDEQWMALVMSLNDSVTQATPGVGFLLGGTLTALASPRVALAVAAAGSIGFTAVSWIVLRPARFPPARTAGASSLSTAGAVGLGPGPAPSSHSAHELPSSGRGTLV
jgi:DHA3 family macrolide efflux protein-like MFS transporter